LRSYHQVIKDRIWFLGALKKDEESLYQIMKQIICEMSTMSQCDSIIKDREALTVYGQHLGVRLPSVFDYFIHVLRVRYPSVASGPNGTI
jgi:hypothetical protein